MWIRDGRNGRHAFQLRLRRTVRLQDAACPAGRDVPVDMLSLEIQNPVAYLVHCLEHERSVDGPLSAEISRIGQQIVDTAFCSAQQKKTLPLLE